ncbi:hypothetical protein QFZ28_004580 [Neobacillus niacini]|nr:hypothetical protein [Neobacillus niacini]
MVPFIGMADEIKLSYYGVWGFQGSGIIEKMISWTVNDYPYLERQVSMAWQDGLRVCSRV